MSRFILRPSIHTPLRGVWMLGRCARAACVAEHSLSEFLKSLLEAPQHLEVLDNNTTVAD